MKLRRYLRNAFLHVPGWHTSRHIVVIESDDWGSIRMPDRATYEALLKEYIAVNNCPYCKYDSLEDNNDLNSLYEVLSKFYDKNGSHPIFTANTVVANPDFDRILNTDFSDYHSASIVSQYIDGESMMQLWKQGISDGLVKPQFHGREHLNTLRWMSYLRAGSIETLLAFQKKMFGLSTNIVKEKRASFLAAYDADDATEILLQKNIIEDGLNQFEQIFGYRSKSFIAPNYVWSNQLEAQLKTSGVLYIQGSMYQQLPRSEGARRIYHYTGEKNTYGQRYLVRNCFFEPAEFGGELALRECLRGVESAFMWRRPAIISTHRLNYIGSIVPMNRETNLKLLSRLLDEITSRWKDVEFMSSDHLGEQLL